MRRRSRRCSFADGGNNSSRRACAGPSGCNRTQLGPARPKTVHLHGLNLSRAWCWQQLSPELGAEMQEIARSAIDRHLDASLPAATAGDYVATHWLASFALLALTDQEKTAA